MSDSEQQSAEVPLSLRWRDAETLPTLHANQLIVSHATGEFLLYFGETVLSPDLLLNFSPETAPDTLDIKPIAKLIISPANMLQFVEIMKRNVERYLAKAQTEKDGE